MLFLNFISPRHFKALHCSQLNKVVTLNLFFLYLYRTRKVFHFYESFHPHSLSVSFKRAASLLKKTKENRKIIIRLKCGINISSRRKLFGNQKNIREDNFNLVIYDPGSWKQIAIAEKLLVTQLRW